MGSCWEPHSGDVLRCWSMVPVESPDLELARKGRLEGLDAFSGSTARTSGVNAGRDALESFSFSPLRAPKSVFEVGVTSEAAPNGLGYNWKHHPWAPRAPKTQ